MKKLLSSVLLLLALTACGEASGETVTVQSVEDLEEIEAQFTEGMIPQVGEYYYAPIVAMDFPTLDAIPVDMDFTTMSSTVSFSVVQMMMYQPEDYWDKTYRIHGTYLYQYIEAFGDVHVILLMDETNCCTGFVEFILPQGVAYPPNGSQLGLIGEYVFIEDEFVPYSILEVTDYEF